MSRDIFRQLRGYFTAPSGHAGIVGNILAIQTVSRRRKGQVENQRVESDVYVAHFPCRVDDRNAPGVRYAVMRDHHKCTRYGNSHVDDNRDDCECHVHLDPAVEEPHLGVHAFRHFRVPVRAHGKVSSHKLCLPPYCIGRRDNLPPILDNILKSS